MNKRKAFCDLTVFRTPNQVILDLEGCPLSGLSPEALDGLKQFLGFHEYDDDEALKRILKFLDIDTRGIGYILRPKKSQYRKLSDNEYIDEWGIKRCFSGLYWNIVNTPLKGATVEDLDHYDWPVADSIDQDEIDLIVSKARQLHETTDYIICASHPVYGIFELGCWMCGFDDFLMKMYLDQRFVHRFFEIVLDYQKQVIERYYSPLADYIDYTSSGDDFATQSGLFVSPKMFKDFIAPYFAERIRYTKEFTNAKYLHHSCGNVAELIPQLIECGVEILNPVQPAGKDMQPHILKQKYGRQIVFHGGLDTQDILPFGTEESIRQAVFELLDVMQPGGGYIFAAAHNLQSDVPPENIVTMFRAAREWNNKNYKQGG
ncbi:MAG: uroporphyrinogen decarboxylase family protein [Caldicoprobacterales bacterium]|jgi:uroporphyrinogen decarboxylase